MNLDCDKRDKLGFGFPNLFYSPMLQDSLALALLFDLKNDEGFRKFKDIKEGEIGKEKK